jgi:predicted RNA-binding Zn ribbon-like protein
VDLISYADRAVLLVNTGPTASGADRLTTLADLRGLLDPFPTWRAKAANADLTHLRAGRGVLREVFDAVAVHDVPRAAALLNPMLSAYPVRPRVTDHDGWPWHLHLAETAASAAEGYLATAAFGLAIAATEIGFERFGVCQSNGCHAVFLDSSSNLSRRYCTERCATRMNVAAYRARRRERSLAEATASGAQGVDALPAG